MNAATGAPVEARYRVTGTDCPSYAAKIENAARKMEGVGEVKVSIASQVMTLSVADPPTQLSAVEQTVTERAARLVRRR